MTWSYFKSRKEVKILYIRLFSNLIIFFLFGELRCLNLFDAIFLLASIYIGVGVPRFLVSQPPLMSDLSFVLPRHLMLLPWMEKSSSHPFPCKVFCSYQWLKPSNHELVFRALLCCTTIILIKFYCHPSSLFYFANMFMSGNIIAITNTWEM